MHKAVFIGVLTCLAHTMAWSVSYDPIADKADLRRKYSYLYSERVVTVSPTQSRFHKATLHRFAGLNVLSLEGDPFEMAFQHGKLLEQEIRDSAAVAASQMVSNAINYTYGHRPIFAAVAKAYIDKKFSDALLSNAVRDYPVRSRSALQQIFALSEGTAIAVPTLIDAALNPSVLMMLANGTKVNNEPVVLAPFHGCSSFAVWDRFSADGDLIVGRNTDYPLTGPFERHATVIYLKPKTGQRHMAIITAGVHSASVTAINESGIFLGMHSMPSKRTGLTGVPPILWLNEVIAESTSMADILARLTTLKYDVGWAFVIASHREKRALTVEVDHSGFGIVESQTGKHVQTNHFRSAELEPNTLFFNAGTRDETFNRWDRLHQLIDAHKGKVGLAEAASFLADRVNLETGEAGGYPSSVAAPTTVTSLVYKPGSRQLFVASGLAPVSGNGFVQLPLPEDFNSSTFGWRRPDFLDEDPWKATHPNRARALRALVEAKEEFEYKNDALSALSRVTQAASEAREVAAYSVVQGLFEIRVGNFRAAKASFLRALAGKLSKANRSVANFYLGRIAAHERNRAEATRRFIDVIQANSSEEKIAQAAQSALDAVSRRGFYRLRKSDVVPQIQFADSQVY